MSRISSRAALHVDTPGFVVAFEYDASRGGFPERYLTIGGNRAYDTGNTCETCAFLFERLAGANRSVSVRAIREELTAGLTGIDQRLLSEVELVLAPGDYTASLITVAPREVVPGGADDYFVHEQIDLWGVPAFWDLPHDPRIAYYRTQPQPMSESEMLYEFLVPMYPSGWLDAATEAGYRTRIAHGERPTALALSVLDVLQPANWKGNPTVTKHWCLTHFLLDGHHKTHAASATGQPLTLLSLLANRDSAATGEEIARLFNAMR